VNDWQLIHQNVISSFLNHVNTRTDAFVLKGDTALLTCYGLDRFSKDIDFDGKSQPKESIMSLVESFCHELCNAFGSDASAPFSRALTNVIAIVGRNRNILYQYERQWDAAP
jgi:hypothetical protein